jgi:hypothetical protein
MTLPPGLLTLPEAELCWGLHLLLLLLDLHAQGPFLVLLLLQTTKGVELIHSHPCCPLLLQQQQQQQLLLLLLVCQPR